MRFFSLLILIIVVAAIAVFAVQNYDDMVTVKYLDQSVTLSIPLLVGAVFGLGMLTGWTIVRILRRSVRHLIEDPGRR
jgi:lipopolysaccharide assembly protein A